MLIKNDKTVRKILAKQNVYFQRKSCETTNIHYNLLTFSAAN